MPSINLDINYFDHYKTRRLIGILGPDADVLPIRLWAYCGRIHGKNGELRGYSAAEIAAVIRWTGEPHKAVRAMINVGFLVRTKRGYACHDWHQHEGHLEAFSRRAKTAAEARWSKFRNDDATSIAKRKSSSAPTVRTVPSLPTKPTETEEGRPVDFSEAVKTSISDAARKRSDALRQIRLLDLRMPFGERKGLPISDLEPDYCQWLIDNKPGIGAELRDALSLRVRVKRDESNGAGSRA